MPSTFESTKIPTPMIFSVASPISPRRVVSRRGTGLPGRYYLPIDRGAVKIGAQTEPGTSTRIYCANPSDSHSVCAQTFIAKPPKPCELPECQLNSYPVPSRSLAGNSTIGRPSNHSPTGPSGVSRDDPGGSGAAVFAGRGPLSA